MTATADGAGRVRRLAEHPLLYGDWSPVVRDGIDVLRLAIAAGALASVLSASWAAAVQLGVGFAAALVGRLARLPRPFDLALVLAVGFDVLGDATALYDTTAWYDLVVHFVLPLSLAPSLYLVLARLGTVRSLEDSTGVRRRLGDAHETPLRTARPRSPPPGLRRQGACGRWGT